MIHLHTLQRAWLKFHLCRETFPDESTKVGALNVTANAIYFPPDTYHHLKLYLFVHLSPLPDHKPPEARDDVFLFMAEFSLPGQCIVYAYTYLLNEGMNEGMNEWASIVFCGA